jgi:hypothetical protein
MENENKRESQVRQRLEEVLEPGEELLAFSKGKTAEVVLAQSVDIGLTKDRIVLLSKKWGKRLPCNCVTIWRENVESMKWSSLWNRLNIRVPGGSFNAASAGGRWKRRLRDLADRHNELSVPTCDLPTTTQRQVEQIETFREIGLITACVALIRNLSMTTELETVMAGTLEEIGEKRLALRVGAGMLFVNAIVGALMSGLMLLLLSGQTGATEGIGIVWCTSSVPATIDILIGFALWRGNGRQWANWAIIRAVLGAVFFGFANLAQGYFLDALLQIALSGSLVLVLTGKGNRTRTWIAIAIFAAVLGVALLSFVFAFLSPLFAGV